MGFNEFPRLRIDSTTFAGLVTLDAAEAWSGDGVFSTLSPSANATFLALPVLRLLSVLLSRETFFPPIILRTLSSVFEVESLRVRTTSGVWRELAPLTDPSSSSGGVLISFLASARVLGTIISDEWLLESRSLSFPTRNL